MMQSLIDGGTGDDVDQGPDDWNKENQNGPTGFRQTVMIVTAEVVDEAPDDEEDHEEDAGEKKHRQEQTQEWVGVGNHARLR
jgi:hypothetical protein